MGKSEVNIVIAGGVPQATKMFTSSIGKLEEAIQLKCSDTFADTMALIKAGQADILILDVKMVAYALPKSLAEMHAANSELEIVLVHTDIPMDQELALFKLPVADVITKYELNPRSIRRIVGRLREQILARRAKLEQSDTSIHTFREAPNAPFNAADVVRSLPANGQSMRDTKSMPALRESPPLRDDAFPVKPLNTGDDIFFASVANASPGFVWRSDRNGDRIFFNKKWLSFRGRTMSQERGRGWFEGIFPAHLVKLQTTLAKAMEQHHNYHLDYRMMAADGNYRWILESATAQFSESGEFIGFVGWGTDINETRMTQTSLPSVTDRKMTPAATSTGDHAPLGMWKLDIDLSVVKANPAASDQLGLERDAVIGKTFNTLMPSVSAETLQKVMSTKTNVQLLNQPIFHYEGNEKKAVYVDLDAWPLMDDGKQVVGVGLSTIEVTDRKVQTEQQEEFVATLVHDLKTPLIGADHTLEILINGALGRIDAGQLEALHLLKQSNRQLLSMVQNLIETYRYESGNQRIALEPVSVTDLVNTAFKDLNVLAAKKSISLVRQLPEPLGMVLADRLAMRRVLQNLLDNAIKFTQNGGRITVSADEYGDHIALHVHDNGRGISEQEQAQLFTRFAQSNSDSRLATGTGLGLYLCKQIVEAHKGSLSCKSVLGSGSTFTLRLPRAGTDQRA